MTARGCREWRHMGVETGVAHDFVVAEMGVTLRQLQLEALRVNGAHRCPECSSLQEGSCICYLGILAITGTRTC